MNTEASHVIYSEDFSVDSSFVNENYAPYINMERDGVDNPEPTKDDNSSPVYIEFHDEQETEEQVTMETDHNKDKVEYENKPNPKLIEGNYQNTSIDKTEDSMRSENHDDSHPGEVNDKDTNMAYATIDDENEDHTLTENDTPTVPPENEYEHVQLPQTYDSKCSPHNSPVKANMRANKAGEAETTETKRESFYDLIDDDVNSSVHYACVNKTPETSPDSEMENGHENDLPLNCNDGINSSRQSITIMEDEAAYTDFENV